MILHEEMTPVSAAVGSHELHSIQRLAAAVLAQAITDLRHGSPANSLEASEWIRSGDTGALSFRTCCEILNRDPDDARRCLLMYDGAVSRRWELGTTPNERR